MIYILNCIRSWIKDEFSKLSLLKDIISCEIPIKYEKLKQKKKRERESLTQIGIRKNYPQDIINNIIKFSYFV